MFSLWSFFCHVFPTTSGPLGGPRSGCRPRAASAAGHVAVDLRNGQQRRTPGGAVWQNVSWRRGVKLRWQKEKVPRRKVRKSQGDVFEEIFFICFCLKVLFVRIVFELNFCFVTFLFLLIILIHLCLSLSLLPEAVQTIQRLANGERVDDAPLARLLRKLFQKPWAWLLAKRGCVKEAARHKSCFVFVLPFFWERLRLGSTYVKLGQFIAYWPQRQTSSTMTKQEIRDLNRSIMIHMIPLYGN